MINKVKLGLNNLYLFENNNGDYLLLDTGLACKEDLILNKIKSKKDCSLFLCNEDYGIFAELS